MCTCRALELGEKTPHPIYVILCCMKLEKSALDYKSNFGLRSVTPY